MDANKPLYIEIPSLLLLLLRIFWHWATPFWMFRDASNGSFEQRMANYRYNRSQRGLLPAYIGKWVGMAIALILFSQLFSEMLVYAIQGTTLHFFATMFCAGFGVGFSLSCIVISILTASYLYLANVER
jgi:hypothetical protein